MTARAEGEPRLAQRLEEWEARFAEREPTVRAYVGEPGRSERLRREAAALEARGVAAPLFGLLLGVKDIFHADGLPTRAGSSLPLAELGGAQGPCVAALRAAGALVLGKTVTTEFAYFASGPTRNPAALDRTPGGSSSGSAAAVAAGLADLALGTQTIGSIGRPAAYCGIAGFKPSYDRISRAGVIPLAPSADHVGFFARDVATIVLSASIAIPDWRPRGAPPRAARVGVPAGRYLEKASIEGREHLERACRRLTSHGVEVVEVAAMDDFAAIDSRHRRLVAAEAAEVHAVWYARYRERYHGKTAELIERGKSVSREELERARAGGLALRAELETAMDRAGLDLWISPPAVGPAPLGLGSTGDPVMNLPWTHAGMPTLVLPAGRSRDGLPMGLQLAARFGADEELLAWAAPLAAALAGLEREGGW